MIEQQQASEFQDLLDKPDSGNPEAEDEDEEKEEDETSWKKRLRVALIHVALVLVSLIYAVFGSLIFYHIESPNERMTKLEGIQKVENFREFIVWSMWNASRVDEFNKTFWMKQIDRELVQFTNVLYTAYKKEFVKFHDISLEPMDVVDDEPVWTNPSALFFAITTMATIGYGNVVPVTKYGRIMCLFFALFGTPLAIITIGDLGKFVSECIIWTYKRYRKLKKQLGCVKPKPPKPMKPITGTILEEDELDELDDEDQDDEDVTYEDILLHRIQVPVIMVFGILLSYIAFGAVLFRVIEGWSYVDSFYFCFISLTTVGFGDLVPKEHKYMIIIMTYIGVGLAVTTMCIDLVGRQYIWKIHYFGRKFKEADLLALLRRKRMIERRLAMCEQNADFRQFYLEALEKQVRLAAQQRPVESRITALSPVNFEKATSESVHALTPQWHTGNTFTYENSNVSVSPVSTNASYYDRINMFNRRLESTASWSPSGPDISFHCSLETDPSVYEREHIYSNIMPYMNNLRSPESFEYTFRLPSPDFEELAKEARQANKRHGSCPTNVPLLEPTGSNMIKDLVTCDSIKTLVEESQDARTQHPHVTLPFIPKDPDEDILPPPLLSPVDSSNGRTPPLSSPTDSTTFEDAFKMSADSGRESTEPEIIYFENIPVFGVVEKPVEAEEALNCAYSCPAKLLSTATPPTVVTENYCFVIDGDVVKQEEIFKDDKWWKPTGRPVHYCYTDDYKKFQRVHVSHFRGKIVSAAVTVPKRSGVGTEQKEVSLSKVFKACRYYSHWRECTSFHRIVTVMSRLSEKPDKNELANRKRIFVQFLWREVKDTDKMKVAMEYAGDDNASSSAKVSPSTSRKSLSYSLAKK